MTRLAMCFPSTASALARYSSASHFHQTWSGSRRRRPEKPARGFVAGLGFRLVNARRAGAQPIAVEPVEIGRGIAGAPGSFPHAWTLAASFQTQ
jgi:hypothetical protein